MPGLVTAVTAQLASAIAAALPALRAEAEARMTSTCTIGTVTLGALDPVTLEQVEQISPVYTGKCRVRRRDVQATEPVVGEVERTVTRLVVSVPWETTGIRPGMAGQITASPSPSLVELRFTVTSVPTGDDQTALRLECKEVADG